MGDTPPPAVYDDVCALFDHACQIPLPTSPTRTLISHIPFRVNHHMNAPQDGIDESGETSTGVDDVFNHDENGNASPNNLTPTSSAAANGASSFSTFSIPHHPKPENKNKKKRNCRNLSIDTSIFIDAESQQPIPESTNPARRKKSKHAGRSPLGEMSGYNTLISKYLNQNTDIPFLFNPEDPDFEELENFCYTQTAPRPIAVFPPQVARLRNRTQRARTTRPRPDAASNTFSRSSVILDLKPVCTVLYNLLEIKDFNATQEDIKVAYRKMAVIFHPDKVKEEVCIDSS
jgi:hypothetical protein